MNGKLKEGDTIIVAGIEGPIVTQIRALLTPQPLKELRVKNQYINNKELLGAQGVKIAAKDLEKALAGIPLFVAQQPDEVDYWKVREIFISCVDFVRCESIQKSPFSVQRFPHDVFTSRYSRCDWSLFSCYNIHTSSRNQVMRILKLIR